MSDLVLILSTASTRAEAENIAETLVAERLAACVQLSAVDSVYRWEGEVEHSAEIRVSIKTRATLIEAVETRIKALHSYDVPQIVVVPITGGSADYLGWIAEETEH